jgi:UDP-N-acetylmuramoyl-tripeptide--D-alanyl-D-alanine ligase
VFKILELLEATKGKLVCRGRDSSFRGISTDSRALKAGEIFIAIKGDNFDGHDFINVAIKKGAACIIKEPKKANLKSKKAAVIEVKDTIKALGEIAHYWRKRFDLPVIAITGSSGKTTTKEMVAWILSGKFKVLKNAGTKNNHIGLPLTLLALTAKHDIAVLELGTNHFGEIVNLARICQPTAGIITNIGPAHLEYFGDLKGVWREKYTLLSQLKSPSIAVLNADDRFLGKLPNPKKHPSFVLRFGLKERCEFLAADEKYASGRLEFRVNKKYKFTLKTLGYYNIYNALAAIACGRIFGIGYKEMYKRLANFEFPEGRLKARFFKLTNFIDDTYNSNPASLKQALEVLGNFETKGRKILVMGDMLELGKNSKIFHYQAGRQAAKVCDKFIAVGKLSRLAMDAAGRSGLNKKDMFSCAKSWQARKILFKYIAPGKDDIILVKGSRAMKMEEIFNIR